ncbi:PTS system mannose/fructose/sorbose family transporter subunit IID [Traorella massiliensis]|uniref:PTS system mannose/fructose/sorbose family transporter subunit IID n=1 Tax=Traorella massiliensis TaxID=1903263 RepID=UPI0023529E9E|nr:PTS system mannose/fructose/sorbose family transporter subunit IID [Traorella massiliensis]
MEKNNENKSSLVTKKDLAWAGFKWYLLAWQCVNYERFVSLGLTSSINHILAKLYKNEDELKEALTRHLEFFNTEPYIGVVIMGIVIAMEEERALKGEEEVSAESITAVKTGLMGPMAGIGDTLNQAILMPLFLAITVSLTLDNNLGVIGPITFVIINCGVMGIETWFFTKFGYKFGKSAVSKILQNGTMDRIVTAAGIVGCAVMGGLTSNYVNLTTKLSFGSGDAVISLQTGLFDAIMPKLLPLTMVLICYALFKKNFSPIKVMLIIMASIGLLSMIGIF